MPYRDGMPVKTATYHERRPTPALRDLVRTVWVQHAGEAPYLQRNLPTGGVELHCPIGAIPRLVGPLTAPVVQVYPPRTSVVGMRFLPGVVRPTFGVPAARLVGSTLPLDALWGRTARVLGEWLAVAACVGDPLAVLEEHFARRRHGCGPVDPLVAAAVRQLMPWRRTETGALGADLAISESQLRRRFLEHVGVGPKALQRTLRFQGFLALVQSAASAGSPTTRIAEFAAELGYADHAHLSRECMRLAGLSPRQLVGAATGCGCGHDHTASFAPFLRTRPRARAAS